MEIAVQFIERLLARLFAITIFTEQNSEPNAVSIIALQAALWAARKSNKHPRWQNPLMTALNNNNSVTSMTIMCQNGVFNAVRLLREMMIIVVG